MWHLKSRISPLWRIFECCSRQFHSRNGGAGRNLQRRQDVERMASLIRNLLPRLAQEMIDDGVLHRIDCEKRRGGSRGHYRDILRQYLHNCSTLEERHETVVSFSLLMNRYGVLFTTCERCLYQKHRCICNHIEKVHPRHDLWVLQHHGEYGRSNNTGGLLCLVAGAKRTIRGLRDQQDVMMKHIEEQKGSAVVLFPKEDAVTIGEYRRQRTSAMGSATEKDRLTLILLDGTSRQAKNLERYMPDDIPRVRLGMPRVKSWLDPIRRQTEEHRVCTAQAAALILRELGDIESSVAIEQAVWSVVRVASERRPLSTDGTATLFDTPAAPLFNS